MKFKSGLKSETIGIICAALVFVFAAPGFSQSNAAQESTPTSKSSARKEKKNKSGKEIGHGGEDIGKGAAKGSVDLGKGAAGGAGDLVTGHPVDAGASVGKGAAGFGRHAGVGAAKGTYKIGKGIGGLFRRHHRKSK